MLLPGSFTASAHFGEWATALCGEHGRRWVIALDTMNDFGLSRPIPGLNFNAAPHYGCTSPGQCYARTVHEALEAVPALRGGKPVDLFGISFGAMTAANVKLAYPRRVRKLALASTAGVFAPLMPAFFLGDLYANAALDGMGDPNNLATTQSPEWVLFRQVLKIARLPARTGAGVMPAVFARAELARLDGPNTLVMVGTRDFCTDPQIAAARALALVPGVTVETVYHAGHMFDVPGDGFTSPKFLGTTVRWFFEGKDVSKVPLPAAANGMSRLVTKNTEYLGRKVFEQNPILSYPGYIENLKKVLLEDDEEK